MKEIYHLFGIEIQKIKKDMYFSLNFGWYSIVLDDNVCYKNSLWWVEEVGGWWGEVGGGLTLTEKKSR